VIARIVSYYRFELRLLGRNGESLLLVAGLPILLLVFFSTVEVLPTGAAQDPVDVLVPGIVTLAVFSTGFVNLAISTGFDRQYGSLKRLGASPLRRGELICSKLAVVATVTIAQATVLLSVGRILGWSGTIDFGDLSLGMALGSIAFTGAALLLAGRLPGVAALATANAIYIVALLISGLLIPLAELPATLRTIAYALPTGALVEITTGATGGADASTRAWLVLVAWAVLTPPLAARFIRWAPN